MDDKNKKGNLGRQTSVSHIEQCLKISPTPPQEPVTIYRAPKAEVANLSKVDIDIITRLEKLRHSRRVDLPSEDEVAARLANLKGLPPDHYAKKSKFQAPDLRTQVEKSDDLFNQVLEEVSLDKKMARRDVDSIETRLSNLRGAMKEIDAKDNVIASENPPSSSLGIAFGEATVHDEVKDLMKEAKNELKKAEKSTKKLQRDPEIHKALSSAHPRHSRKSSSTSSAEKFSSSDSDEEVGASALGSVKKGSKEEQEVERIVKLYTKKAEERKRKKKKRQEAVKGSQPDLSSSSDDEGSLSSSSLVSSDFRDELSSLSDQ